MTNMTSCRAIVLLFVIGFSFGNLLATAQETAMAPVTKNASPEAVALLKFFYRISGEYILTGQHNFPNVMGRNTKFATQYIGKTPVVYSTDWGFAFDGNFDSYHARQEIVNEAIRQNKKGSIITICWHAVPPTADEPVTFQPLPGADSAVLKSVQGHLLDEQFRDVLTPGTALYKHWCIQVDSIAVYLQKLQDAHVPIVWRPYHEMNGNWFWWGGRTGEYSTIRLYRQLFDRLVNVHKLTNLIWMWNVDRPSLPERKFSNFYVGNKFFDIASLDVYGSDFNQDYYDSLLVLAKGKPITLGEVGNPPTPDVLKRQPKWTYYVIWASMVRNTLKKEYQVLMNNSHVLFLDDTAYWNAIAPYRMAAGLPSLYAVPKEPLNFSGQWSFNEAESQLDNMGTGSLPIKLEVMEDDTTIDLKKTLQSEYSDNTIVEQRLPLNGEEKPFKAPYGNGPMIVKAHRSDAGDTLYVVSSTTFKNGNQVMNFVTGEAWSLQENGKTLVIKQTSSSLRGKRSITVIYNRQL